MRFILFFKNQMASEFFKKSEQNPTHLRIRIRKATDFENTSVSVVLKTKLELKWQNELFFKI